MRTKYSFTLGHIDGSMEAQSIGMGSDSFVKKQRRPFKEIFFKPFDAAEDFLFSVKYTVLPGFVAFLWASQPELFLIVPPVFLAMAAAFALITMAADSLGFETIAEITDYTAHDLGQFCLNMAVLPVSSLVMFTRICSTVLSGMFGIELVKNNEGREPSLADVKYTTLVSSSCLVPKGEDMLTGDSVPEIRM